MGEMLFKQEILNKIQDVQDRIETLKEEFASTIADTDIDLEERWDLFVKAPDFLKEHRGWVEDFKAFPCEITWYDDFSIEKHEIVYTAGIVERIVEDFIYAERYSGTSKFKKMGFTSETVEKLKEEILSMNLGSFTYDW